jgi:phosphomannomutase
LGLLLIIGTANALRVQNGNLVVIGRDSRVSGPWIEEAVIGTLSSFGFDILHLGIVPTPTVQYYVKVEQAIGGIIVTSSHNPEPWNGLKFVDSDSLFLAPDKA